MHDGDPALEALYPFLEGTGRGEPPRPEGLEESVARKAAESLAVKESFFAANGRAVVDMAAGIAAVYRHGGRMLAMGNGGSYCDAAHFAVEFLHPITAGRPALTVVNLAADTATLTALANDVGYEQAFARQVIAHGRRGDGLIGFSTSGNSPDLLHAFGRARELGLATFGLCGGGGGRMVTGGAVDHCLAVPTDSVHRVQETHVMVYHVLWDLVHTLLAGDRGGTAS